MPWPTYTISTDLPNGYDAGALAAEIEALGIQSATFQSVHLSDGADTCDIVTDPVNPSPGDITLVEGVLAAHSGLMPLNEYKCRKMMEFDKRTKALIKAGFTHSSKQFSLSANSQMKLAGAHALKSSMTYPVNWNDISNLDVLAIADEAAFDAFYQSAFDTLRGHLDSGTALKDSVRAAADHAAVDAVVDNR